MPQLISQNTIARKVAGYTRFVVLGRGLLWLLIAALVFLIIYIAIGNRTSDKVRLVFSDIKQMEDLQNVMKNPDYQGFDNNNMPYRVLADQATQYDADTVLLNNIRADLMTKKGNWLALYSGAGKLHNTDKTLQLTKGVNMFYDGGYEFRSEMAFVDIAKGSASGNQPVNGQGPVGTIEAQRFSVYDRGDILIFEGSVKVVIYRE